MESIIARRKALAGYCIAASLLAWTHYAQTYFVAACAIMVALALLRHKILLKEWLLANGAVLTFTAAELPLMLHVAADQKLLMIKVPFIDIPGNIAIMLSGTSFPVLACLLTGLICYSGCLLWKKAALGTRLVLIEVPAFYVALLFIATIFHSIFVARILVMLSIPASLIMAKILIDIPAGAVRNVAGAAIVLTYAISMPHDLHATPFRQIFAAMTTQYQPGDAVVFGPYDRIGALGYYQPGIVSGGIERWRPEDQLPILMEDRFWNETFSATMIDTVGVQSLIDQHRTVWLILLEDDRLVTKYRNALQPALAVFADDSLLHVYLWQGAP